MNPDTRQYPRPGGGPLLIIVPGVHQAPLANQCLPDGIRVQVVPRPDLFGYSVGEISSSATQSCATPMRSSCQGGQYQWTAPPAAHEGGRGPAAPAGGLGGRLRRPGDGNRVTGDTVSFPASHCGLIDQVPSEVICTSAGSSNGTVPL